MTCQKKISERFGEICGSWEPKIAARKLGIPYQSAIKYLSGERTPGANMLLKIAERTPYSVHWLLTGEGEKFVVKENYISQDTLLLTDQIRNLIRKEIFDFFTEKLNRTASENKVESGKKEDSKELTKNKTGQSVVQLRKSRILSEKPVEKPEIQT